MDETDARKERTNVGGLKGPVVVACRMYKHLRLKYEDQYCVKFRQEYWVQA